MEAYDVVNEQDEVIGTISAEECHKTPNIHRVVAVFVFTPDGKLYVQDHIKTGKLDHSVGGHVDSGEDYDTAVIREAMEELGVSGPFTKIAHFLSHETSAGEEVRHYFTVYECIPENWQFVPNEEVQTVTPRSLPDIIDQMNREPEAFTLGFLHTMKEYILYKKLPYTVKHS